MTGANCFTFSYTIQVKKMLSASEREYVAPCKMLNYVIFYNYMAKTWETSYTGSAMDSFG
eukprot:1357030-Pleurochrysis_carterae.AAC.1